MTEEPTIQSLGAQLREDGYRELADAVDYVNHSVAGIPESDASEVQQVIDTDSIPLPPETKLPFVIGMVFGTLLERRYPKDRQSEWPVE